MVMLDASSPRTSSSRPPWSIIVVVAVWALTGAASMLVTFVSAELIGQAVSVIVSVWGVIALWRMSRWPIVATIASTTGSLAWNLYSNPAYLDQFPLLGVWAIIVPCAIFLLLVLPHWKRMNWSVFGRSDWSTGAA